MGIPEGENDEPWEFASCILWEVRGGVLGDERGRNSIIYMTWPINRAATCQGFHFTFGSEIGGATSGCTWDSTFLNTQDASKMLLAAAVHSPFLGHRSLRFFFRRAMLRLLCGLLGRVTLGLCSAEWGCCWWLFMEGSCSIRLFTDRMCNIQGDNIHVCRSTWLERSSYQHDAHHINPHVVAPTFFCWF